MAAYTRVKTSYIKTIQHKTVDVTDGYYPYKRKSQLKIKTFR